MPPLRDKRVVVTRPLPRARELGALLEAAGARAVYLPCIEIAAPTTWEPLDRAVEALLGGGYAWVALASTSAVSSLFARLERAGAGPSIPPEVRVAAVGPSTAAELGARGVVPDVVPPIFAAAELGRVLAELGPPGRVLMPRVEGRRDGLEGALAGAGWALDEVPAYRNVLPPASPELRRVRAGEFDIVTFTSGSTAANFVTLVGGTALRSLGLTGQHQGERAVACIGPATARAAAARGLRVAVVAREHTARGLVAALSAHEMWAG